MDTLKYELLSTSKFTSLRIWDNGSKRLSLGSPRGASHSGARAGDRVAGLRNRSQHFQKSIQEDLFREEGLEVFKEFERLLIEHRRSNTTDENQAQARLVDVERD